MHRLLIAQHRPTKLLLWCSSMEAEEPKPKTSNQPSVYAELERPEQAAIPRVLTVAEACERALYHEGIAVVENLGVPPEVIEALHTKLTAEQVEPMEEEFQLGTKIYYGFEPEDTVGVLNYILSDESQPFSEPYDAVNMQYNVYQPGARFGRHTDMGGDMLGAEPPEALTFIYVTKGQKQLRVWLAGQESNTSAGTELTQTPDMLIVLRGGEFISDQILYPGIMHEVPEVTEGESAILTFEIMPRAKATAYNEADRIDWNS